MRFWGIKDKLEHRQFLQVGPLRGMVLAANCHSEITVSEGFLYSFLARQQECTLGSLDLVACHYI